MGHWGGVAWCPQSHAGLKQCFLSTGFHWKGRESRGRKGQRFNSLMGIDAAFPPGTSQLPPCLCLWMEPREAHKDWCQHSSFSPGAVLSLPLQLLLREAPGREGSICHSCLLCLWSHPQAAPRHCRRLGCLFQGQRVRCLPLCREGSLSSSIPL